MKKKNRLYSIPYNGVDVDYYIEEMRKRIRHIHHVYCELPFPSVLSQMQLLFQDKNGGSDINYFDKRLAFLSSCDRFLKKSKGVVKRICPINAMYYKFDTKKDFVDFGFEVVNLVDRYELEGVILTDFRLADFLRGYFPKLEIHTSCNAYQWNIRQMQIWKDFVGAEVFNPPREILRVPSKLKEMSEAGFKLKCLVNEGCLVGCPNSFNHQMSVSLGCLGSLNSCTIFGPGDILRGNYVLPRWQRHYDEFVYIYKISGRNVFGDYPFRTLDAYLSENDSLPLTDLCISGVVHIASMLLPDDVKRRITLDMIPDKLAFCECKTCVSCRLCDNIMNRVVPTSLHGKFYSRKFKFNEYVPS